MKFDWGEKAEAAFQLLKQKLCSAPILELPEGSENYMVYCDASHKGLGAVLMQKERVIAYKILNAQSEARKEENLINEDLQGMINKLEPSRTDPNLLNDSEMAAEGNGDLSSIKVNGVTDDALRLYLFPYSLTHHATAWFDRLPRNSINTFEHMAKMFLGKYFSPSMVTKLRNEITNFRQRPDESLFEAWERYKLSIDRCSNHNMLPVNQIDTFYNGLTLRHRDTINADAGGTFIKRRPEECYELIENMTAHHNDWDTSTQRSESSSSITSSTDTKIAALKAKMAEINKNLMKVLQVNQQVKEVTPNYETCSGPHSFSDCPATVGNTQNVYAMGAYQEIATLKAKMAEINKNLMRVLQPPLATHRTYMLRDPTKAILTNLRATVICSAIVQTIISDHQGANQGQNPPLAYQAPSYQALVYQASVHQPHIPQPQVVTTNEFTNFMKANDAILKNMQTNMTSLINSNLELKNMFGQFMKMNTASSLGSGTLPSNTITNPKEDLKGITTRSGTAYQGPTIPTTFSSLPPVVEREIETESLILNSEPIVAPIIEPVNSPVSALKPNQRPSIPYPLRFQDQKLHDKANEQQEKFFQIFKDLNFNISFDDALILMPKFGLSIKSLLTNKDKICKLARTPLNEHCSAVLLKKLPEKLGDPDKFLISCDFPKMAECLALTDLDASINLIPLFVWNKLYLLDLSPTCMTLELADRLISPSVGVAEDFFVKVGTFHFLADFVVVDFDADPRVPLILERYFLKTERALIDVESDFLLEEVDAFLALEDDPTSPEGDQSYVDTEGDILLLEAFLNDDPSLPLPNQGNYLPLEDFKLAVQHQRRVNPKIYDIIKNEVVKIPDAGLIYPIYDSPWVSPVHCIPKKGGFTIVKNEENELIPTRLVTGWRVCIDYQRMLKRCEDTTLCLNWEKSHFMVEEGIVLGHKISKNGIEVDKAKVDVIAKLPHPTTIKVLGQHQEKLFRPVHYSSKTMTEAESNYTTTKKEMFAVVYAFEKFWSYLIMNKSIVYMDHSTLKYLFAKKDFKARLLRWVEAKALCTNDARVVCKFLKYLFARFGTPRVIINDHGTHFYNDQFAKVMLKYGVTYCLAVVYHPQTSGRVEVSNRGLKRILERTVGENHASWSDKLDDAL
nr:reverse transcriptase domain-containing protein [Tanacetum cinerariifolium]